MPRMTSLWVSADVLADPPPARLRPATPRRGQHRPATIASPPRPSRPWHFYRRRAAAVGVLTIALLFAWWVQSAVAARLVSSPSTQWSPPLDVPVTVHHAEPGETLWSLAVQLGPNEDPRVSLDVLIRLNGQSELIAGEPVRVPQAWYRAASVETVS
jgi:hypothetical protein